MNIKLEMMIECGKYVYFICDLRKSWLDLTMNWQFWKMRLFQKIFGETYKTGSMNFKKCYVILFEMITDTYLELSSTNWVRNLNHPNKRPHQSPNTILIIPPPEMACHSEPPFWRTLSLQNHSLPFHSFHSYIYFTIVAKGQNTGKYYRY